AISLAGLLLVALLAGAARPANGVDGPEPALPRDRSLAKMIVAYGLFGFGYVVTASALPNQEIPSSTLFHNSRDRS
ncbi:YbfB/YjiJ family MFS transporter, partial [bacterium M00.F.Ca.ET.141.01.1.1]